MALPLTPKSPICRLRFMDSHCGGCHCGNLHVRLGLSKPPEDNALRACTCSFCRSHSPRMVADAKGLFEVWADDWSLVENYRFGTRTCDFLICRRCGVFIAAVTEMTSETRAVVNVNCLNDRDRFTSVPVGQDVAARGKLDASADPPVTCFQFPFFRSCPDLF